MKQIFDFVVAVGGLIVLSPVLILVMVLIWLQDFRSPLYLAPRMANKNKKFNMVKLRSMVINADQLGGTSTASTDKRITWIGSIIRKFKLTSFFRAPGARPAWRTR